MRCRQVRNIVGRQPEASWPEGIRRHLERCEACQRFWRRTKEVVLLMGLKRYEQPSEMVLRRMRISIHRRLVEYEHTCLEEQRDGLTLAVFLRYAAAAAALALLVSRIVNPGLPRLSTSLPEHFRVIASEEAFRAAATNDQFGYGRGLIPVSTYHLVP